MMWLQGSFFRYVLLSFLAGMEKRFFLGRCPLAYPDWSMACCCSLFVSPTREAEQATADGRDTRSLFVATVDTCKTVQLIRDCSSCGTIMPGQTDGTIQISSHY